MRIQTSTRVSRAASQRTVSGVCWPRWRHARRLYALRRTTYVFPYPLPIGCINATLQGVIALTGCASRRAGYAACFFLVLAGVASKFGAAIAALPQSVIGGMTTFLFTTIVVSGLRILSSVPWTRRNRFIVTAALTLGLSDLVVPNWAAYLMPTTGTEAAKGFYQGVGLIIQTAYCIVAFVACFLNAVMPERNGAEMHGDKKGLVLPVAVAEREEAKKD